ncbi:MAG: quinone oxidoreductase family protein [Pikeienuella sp.]
MVKRIQITEFGGPEVMQLVDEPMRALTPGEVLINNKAIGLNFIDTYHRTGLYPMPLPMGLGLEGAGVVESVGKDVTDLKPGDRVGYCAGAIGAYGEKHIMPADRVIRTPDGISDDIAAASLLKGLTTQYLIRQIYRVKAGETVLFHAAAGGVGLIAVQWLKHLGATVIGTVGSQEKAALAKAAGCDHIIFYNHENIAEKVSEITKGAKVPVVFDGVGASTWEASLDSLAPRGLMISYGNASGPVTDVNLGILAAKGSLFVTRPTLFAYTDTREALLSAAADLYEVIQSGAVNIDINAEYALADVAQAHRDLEGRKTTGSTLLRP